MTTRPVLVLTLVLGVVAIDIARPAVAHHVGAYTARDNEISANFKQIKFSVQARKFAVARRLFEEGAVRKEMQQRAARLPAGLEASTRAALKRDDTNGVEVAL